MYINYLGPHTLGVLYDDSLALVRYLRARSPFLLAVKIPGWASARKQKEETYRKEKYTFSAYVFLFCLELALTTL